MDHLAQAKNKMLHQRQTMVKAEQELVLPIVLSLDAVKQFYIKGSFFEGRWVPVIIVKAF